MRVGVWQSGMCCVCETENLLHVEEDAPMAEAEEYYLN